MEEPVPIQIGQPYRTTAKVSERVLTPKLTDALLAQARNCKRDDPHSPKCKRCARGRRDARTA